MKSAAFRSQLLRCPHFLPLRGWAGNRLTESGSEFMQNGWEFHSTRFSEKWVGGGGGRGAKFSSGTQKRVGDLMILFGSFCCALFRSFFVSIFWLILDRFEMSFWSIFGTQIDQQTHMWFSFCHFDVCSFCFVSVVLCFGGCYARLILVLSAVRC